MRQAWELGPFAAVLQSLALDTPLLKLQNTGTKNNPVHVQLRQIWDQKIQKRQKEKKRCHFWRAKNKTLVSQEKAGTVHAPTALNTTGKVGKTI